MVSLDRLVRILAVAGARATPALGAALLEETHLAFRKSQVEAPFRFGILKGSGRVKGPVFMATKVKVEISYGGAASAYAYILHKGVIDGKTINFKNGKKAQYLYDPVKAQVAGMDDRIANRIEAILGDG
jgi:hypothetical protein